MNFEVPSYMVLLGVLAFGSTQAVIVWQLRVLIEDFRDYKNKLSEFKDECEHRFAYIELNCVRHHGNQT